MKIALALLLTALIITAQQPAELAMVGAGGASGAVPALDQHSAGNYCSSSCTSETASLNATAAAHVFIVVSFCATVACASTVTTSNCASLTSVSDGVNTYALVGTSDSIEPAPPTTFVSLCVYEIVSAASGAHTITASSGLTTLYYIAVFWASFTNTTGSHDQFGNTFVQSVSTSPHAVQTSGNLSSSNELLFGAWVRNTGGMSATTGTSIDTGMFFGQGVDHYQIGGTAGSPASLQAAATSNAASYITGAIVTVP